MDTKLRELERQAITDLDAAHKLIRSLKRLIRGQWQAFQCKNCTLIDDRKACHKCGGFGWVRYDVLQLPESVSD